MSFFERKRARRDRPNGFFELFRKETSKEEILALQSTRKASLTTKTQKKYKKILKLTEI
jgi:hypothetical protein